MSNGPNDNEGRVKCPHCLVVCYIEPSHYIRSLGSDSDGYWWLDDRQCPNCGKRIAWLVWSAEGTTGNPQSVGQPEGEQLWTLVRPKSTGRSPVPIEVPEEFAEDYKEACLVLSDSPKASAALSRRALQHILREKAGVKNPNDLAKAIKEVVEDPATPPPPPPPPRASRTH